MAVCGGDDMEEEWIDLMCMADQQGLDDAAEKVCVRWGLMDFADWGEAVMSLAPDQQRQFRKEVEAILERQPEVIHEDY
jgi:hypothetical protein